MFKNIFAIVFLITTLFLSGCLKAIPKERLQKLHHSYENEENLRFIVFGDMGSGSPDQYAVAKAMHTVCAEKPCHFAIGTGDNIYPNGPKSAQDPIFETNFELPYSILGDFDFWMILGNHDWKQLQKSAQAEIDRSLYSERWLLPNYHYSVPALPSWITIYGLDTTLMDAGISNPQIKKAREALCPQKGWKFLFGHHPTQSSGKHGTGELKKIKKMLEPVIKDCGVQFYFAGHDHHQEHLDMKFYQQVIQGAGGAQVLDVRLGTEGQKFAAAKYGFALIDINRNQLEMIFYDSNADELYRYAQYPLNF